MKILCVHGVQTSEQNTQWQEEWETVITNNLPHLGQGNIEFQFVEYNDVFENSPLNTATYLNALKKLAVSYITHMPGWGAKDVDSDPLRWTVGMVAQWVIDDTVKTKTREKLIDDIKKFQPDIICAHSIGALISYDTFIKNPSLVQDKIFITCGSQIGNSFVRNEFGGYLKPLDTAKYWYNLYNQNDLVCTADISLPVDNFKSIPTPFGFPQEQFPFHDPIKYFNHIGAKGLMWPSIDMIPEAKKGIAFTNITASRDAVNIIVKEKAIKKKALLIGINNYQDTTINKLSGCINDAFLMSSVLQEVGFDPNGIEVVFNDNATKDNIVKKLDWLLSDAREGDQRVFFYSGHGSQFPVTDIYTSEPDHMNECLVPFDFDRNNPAGSSVTDKMFNHMYSNLSYDIGFISIFDSCHSGGIARGNANVKGIDMVDEIKHRMLKWDQKSGMWIARKFNRAAEYKGVGDGGIKQYTGGNGATHKFGRSPYLRLKQAGKGSEYGNNGPYMPVILEACKEGESALEYMHGSVSYGAFTFSVAKTIRESRSLTFSQLNTKVNKILKNTLRYNQHSGCEGPTFWLNQNLFELFKK